MTDVMDAQLARTWMAVLARAVHEHRDELTSLDTAIGDGDHGVNLDRGFAAVTTKLAEADQESLGTPSAVLMLTGRTLISTVGGASGPLYGTAFRDAAKALGETAEAGPEEMLAALGAGLDGVRRLGSATEGDKTMVDAFAPALGAFEAAVKDGASLQAAADSAASAARDGARATIELEARKGRASYLGPRSIGHQDPGATSTALLFDSLYAALDRQST